MVGTSSCKEGMALGIAVHFPLDGGWEWWTAPSVDMFTYIKYKNLIYNIINCSRNSKVDTFIKSLIHLVASSSPHSYTFFAELYNILR
jgi:hypothetical protein